MTTFTTHQILRVLFTEQFARQRFCQDLLATSVALVTLLLLSVNSLYGQDSLHIDPNGNVTLKGSLETSNIGINNAPISNQSLVIIPKKDFIPLNVTDPENKKHWLTVLSTGDVDMKNAVITGTDETSSLLLKGSNGSGLTLQYKTETVEGQKKQRIGFKGRQNWILWSEANTGNSYIYGNLGIGKETPTAKLDMAGDAKIDGGLTVSGKGNSSFAGNVGIGTASPTAKLHLQGPSVGLLLQDGNNTWSMYNESGTNSLIFQKGGDKGYNGFRHDGSLVSASDARLKKEVRELPDVLARALKLRPVSYKLKSETNSATRLGFIAQEVEPLFPEVVSEMAGFKGIAYADMVPIAIGAIKELDQIVRESQAALDESTTKVERLERKVAGQDELLLWPRYLDNGTYDLPLWKSDARFKTDVCTISAALDKVNRLNGITYRWNRTALDYFTSDIEKTISAGPNATKEANRELWQKERDKRYKELAHTQVGVVAQDVEAVLPEAVTTDESGYKSARYYELIPLLIEALKEEDGISKGQSETIARQQTEIQRLTVANQAVQQQLDELQDVKQKVAYLEAAMSRLASSGSSRDHNALVSSAEGSK